MGLFKKEPAKEEKKGCCPGCGMPVTDPTWLVCPRCRTVINKCGGCADCGKCVQWEPAKKKG